MHTENIPMDTDYSALASRVAAFSDVLGCIILSSDGLVLGSFPPADGDGDGIKAAWLRFAGIGNPERGFVKVTILPGRDQYPGSAQNGVTTDTFGAWGGSFSVERATPPRGEQK